MRKNKATIKAATSASLLVLLSMSTTAFAQDDGAREVEVITVTATRRAESIQDVPISISAYNAEFIEDSGVTDIRDVALYSPNFTISSSSQLSNNRIAIRGVGSVGNSGIEPSVGVFIDGVYYPKPGSVIGNLMDIQSFEVLRGPQGTLFGRNTPVGALNITTKKPNFEEYSGTAELGFGSFGATKLGASLNVPLNENAAMLLSAKHTDRDGYGKNLLSGDDIKGREDLNLRGKLVYEPTETLSMTFIADSGKIESGGATVEFLNGTESPFFLGTLGALAGLDPSVVDSTGNPITAASLVTSDPYDHDVYQDTRDDLTDEQFGFSFDTTYELGSGHKIRSISATRSWEADYFESAIRLPIKLFPRKTDYDSETYSQEIQFLSPVGGAFDYIAGAFWYKEDYSISQDFDLGSECCNPVVFGTVANTPALGGPAAAGPTAAACDFFPQIDASDGDIYQRLTSTAFFAQGTYHASDALRFTLGGRHTADDKTASFSNVVNNPFVIALSVRDNESWSNLDIAETRSDGSSFDDSKFTYFANASWDYNDDIMLFATTSSGFKSGGFNTDGTFPALTRDQRIFGPEDTTNYELGMKSTLLDGSMLLNLTAFRMNIDGFQDRAFDGISFITRNVGELLQQGIEADMNWAATDRLNVIGGFSYLDSEFLDYRNASPLPGGAPQDLTGQRAHFAPKTQYSLVGDWSDDTSLFGGSQYYIRGELQNTGEQNVGANTNRNPQTNIDAYTLLNARAGFRSADDTWEVGVWGKNVADEGYCMTIFAQPFASQLNGVNAAAATQPQRCVTGTPRTWGVDFKYRF